MKFKVELLAFGKPGEVREVEVPVLYSIMPKHPDKLYSRQIVQEVFLRGQNEEDPQDHPSVSAGDVIQIGEDRWLVLAVGFHKLTATQYEEYTAAPHSERLSLSMFGFGKPV